MTNPTTSTIVLSPFDWQEAEVGTIRHRSRFRFRRVEGERPKYEEMFTVISIFDGRFLEVHATSCGDNMIVKTTFKELSFSPSDVVLVIPYHERSIAIEDQSNA